VAKEFASTKGIILKLSIHNGKSISSYSPFPTENEILLSPNMKFIVTLESYIEDGYQCVDLLQVTDNTFVF
jgi:hypothetical protein